MKQEMMVPSYMADFKCIAGKCEETCCAGWYIAIDENTYKKYKKVKQPEMKKRLEKELVVKKGGGAECVAKIKLKNNRCAFLAKDNLCDIYKNLGEQYLSETCTIYPRNINSLGPHLELSLALSCPEAARVILLRKEGIRFTEEMVENLPIVGAQLQLQPHAPKQFEDYILKMRRALLAIWQQRGHSIEEKWQVFEYVIMKFHEFKSRQELKRLAQFLDGTSIEALFKQGRDFKPRKSLQCQYMSEETARKIYVSLKAMRESKKWPSTRYEQCYQEMLEGLGETLNNEQYREGKALYEKVLLQQHAYLLENYFVNYIYERLVPINQTTPLESLEEMYLYFAIIRLHLIGMAAKNKQLTVEDCVTLIQTFTRVFDHNELYLKQIKKQLGS